MKMLLCLGFGYCAGTLAPSLLASGQWRVAGTSRNPFSLPAIAGIGAEAILFDGSAPGAELRSALGSATHLLISAAPDGQGDPVLRSCGEAILESGRTVWIGYLSSIGVYGNADGAWVDEETPPRPSHDRAKRRLAAEQSWLDIGSRSRTAVQVFRVAGIYGPGRNALVELKAGTARRIVKPGQVFNRVHVDDIAQTLEAAIHVGRPGRVYNIADDLPLPSDEVIEFAARLLGVPPPPTVPFAECDLPPLAASFYSDNRRARNERIKLELCIQLMYPTYREGLTALASRQGPSAS